VAAERHLCSASDRALAAPFFSATRKLAVKATRQLDRLPQSDFSRVPRKRGEGKPRDSSPLSIHEGCPPDWNIPPPRPTNSFITRPAPDFSARGCLAVVRRRGRPRAHQSSPATGRGRSEGQRVQPPTVGLAVPSNPAAGCVAAPGPKRPAWCPPAEFCCLVKRGLRARWEPSSSQRRAARLALARCDLSLLRPVVE